MALIERDNLALFHYSASEIWSDKRYDIWLGGSIREGKVYLKKRKENNEKYDHHIRRCDTDRYIICQS